MTAVTCSARSRAIRWARWLVAGAIVLGTLGISVAGRAIDRTGRATLRVLFIGNSYTRFNDLPRMVAELSESAQHGPTLRTSRETHGGFDLRQHWRIRRVRQRVERGGFDVVVLQPHSLGPIRDPGELEEYARRFSTRVRAAGAQPVLFETWARHPRSRVYRRYQLRDPGDMLARVESVYARVGRDLGVPVAPVGRAWERALAELPDVRLHRPDGTHPNLAGTYLAACVLYGTLSGTDPREATYAPWRLPRTEARRIREVAAESLAR